MNGQRVKSGADGFCRKCRPTPPTTPSAAPVQVAPVAVAPVAAYPVYPAPVAAPQGAAAPLAPTVHVDTVPELSTAPVPAPAFKGYPTKGTFTVTIAKTKTDAAKNEKEMVLKIISADFMNRAGEGVWTRVAPGLWQTVCRKYQESDSVQVTVEPFTTPERVLIGRITKIRMVDASPRTDGVKGADSPPAGRKTLKTPERTTTQPTIEATPVMAECDMCDAPIPVNGPTTCASCTAELEATYARLRSMRVSAPKA